MIKSQKADFRNIGVVNNITVLAALLKRNPFLRLIKAGPRVFFALARRIAQERLARARRMRPRSGLQVVDGPPGPPRKTHRCPENLPGNRHGPAHYPLATGIKSVLAPLRTAGSLPIVKG